MLYLHDDGMPRVVAPNAGEVLSIPRSTEVIPAELFVLTGPSLSEDKTWRGKPADILWVNLFTRRHVCCDHVVCRWNLDGARRAVRCALVVPILFAGSSSPNISMNLARSLSQDRAVHAANVLIYTWLRYIVRIPFHHTFQCHLPQLTILTSPKNLLTCRSRAGRKSCPELLAFEWTGYKNKTTTATT